MFQRANIGKNGAEVFHVMMKSRRPGFLQIRVIRGLKPNNNWSGQEFMTRESRESRELEGGPKLGCFNEQTSERIAQKYLVS